ncbi:hypothetical protein [Corallococcus sp. EGB]|uniref:hypothetical protein n=1 Tax=Corallococcus sp. EGB TaxID=1521117 RepID=UPI001CBE29F8|nr:hypothetical protein [Corallococcus sp. EGB]
MDDDDTPATPNELVAETRAARLLPTVYVLDGEAAIIVEDREGLYRVEQHPQGIGWAQRIPCGAPAGTKVASRAAALLLLLETGWQASDVTLH